MAEHTPGPNTNALIVAAGVAEQENERLRAINADLLAACEAVAGVFAGIEDVPLFAVKCRAAIAKARAL